MVSLPEIAGSAEPTPKTSSAPRRMNPTEIEFALRDLVSKPFDAETFTYDLFAIFNASKVTVSRLKSGTTNKATQPGDVLWQKQFFFRHAQPGDDVGAVGDALMADPLISRHKPRFILVTNGQQVHIRDLKFEETVNIEFERLDEQSYFLLPLAGYERRAIVEEHPADIKAAKKLKKLYDAILAANPTWSSGHHSHELNLLMTRLLFCFYAEDTGIFETPQIFTNSLTQHTVEDGSDVATLLDSFFRVMNVEAKKRPANAPAIEAKFPYVNGSLFENTVEIPTFSRTARRQMLECGDLDWTTINPDIFGSMIQTIAQDGTRSDLGMHYTSAPNIMKVLQPLFLDDLMDAYEKAKDSPPKLEALLGRIGKIRIFDPACGSGNFLIVAYKRLRELEIQILLRIREVSPKSPLLLSGISVGQFYGIDLVDFACETAKLSLWIAEHQMNMVFRNFFGQTRPTLPLPRITTVHQGNALRMDWLQVCPYEPNAETYVCGNPPYQGSIAQTDSQKSDIASIFDTLLKAYKDVDYVACWFVKATNYINATETTSSAFVATNSICQGEQVAFLWPYVFSRNIDIAFAHTTFKWQNSAAHNAVVFCIIVGLSMTSAKPKRLFTDTHEVSTQKINAYLVPSKQNVIVKKTPASISGLPQMVKGNLPNDGGNLILSPLERKTILASNPEGARFIRRFYSSKDFIYNLERYVLWIPDNEVDTARRIPTFDLRFNLTGKARKAGGSQARSSAATPHRFAYVSYRDAPALIVPEITIGRRQYHQIGLLEANAIANNKLYLVYDPPAYLLAILSSRLHYLWSSTVGAHYGPSLSYSVNLIYNTFPVPTLSHEQKRLLGEHSKAILKTRARYPGKTIADLYNPETMPPDLAQTHYENDVYLEQYVYGRTFADDTHRLEHLFTIYANKSAANEAGGSLFEPSTSTKGT